MKFVLWVSGLFALAVLIGLSAMMNNGYVLLFLPPYRIELSFNLLLILIVALILTTYGLMRVTQLVLNLPAHVRRFQRQKRLRKARHALREAVISFFEGRFQKAERSAVKSMVTEYAPENKAIALLIAARAANMTQDYEKRSQYLQQFDALPPYLHLARHILETELKIEAKDYLGALAAIERARELAPHLTHALKLELKLRSLQKQPEAVLSLTDKLLKADALEQTQVHHYRLAAYTQQLDGLLSSQEIQEWFKSIAAPERQDVVLISYIARRLVQLGDVHYAARLLAHALDDENSVASAELARELAQLAEQLSDAQRLELLKEGEGWLKKRPHDSMLLLALGRLAHAQQLWGKAQSYFEASLSIQPTLLAHAELVKLFQATGQESLAARHSHDCLNLALAHKY